MRLKEKLVGFEKRNKKEKDLSQSEVEEQRRLGFRGIFQSSLREASQHSNY